VLRTSITAAVICERGCLVALCLAPSPCLTTPLYNTTVCQALRRPLRSQAVSELLRTPLNGSPTSENLPSTHSGE
jgi:hypothetical protein